ncbi:MAG: tRNA (N6-isopentenyl adenosine(37)-C2)-methylthiotransferase MiaB, partial [Thermodesulfobacteriota bacterium]
MKCKGRAYIYTIGCQMNVYDSEKLGGVLRRLGYAGTDSLKDADIVVCNTCSIRNKAQEKAFSFLGTLAKLKKVKPHLISVMAGCVAQQEGERAFRRLPHLDIVLGTQAFSRFADHIRSVQTGRSRIADTDSSSSIYESVPDSAALEKEKVSRFVTIMQGCENFCTYCVVPYVRGRERSRDAAAIVREIEILADQGVAEVTLLGQNVNSYGQKEGTSSFAGLLEMISNISGIKRIRFATSHPKDLSDELIHAVNDLEKVCPHVHLPVQSGSDRILKKMNRGYTTRRYIERVSELRRICGEIAISSDFIAGFPSETMDDFQKSLDLVREIEFDSIFAFSYSDRPNAPASKFSGHIDEQEKLDRLNALLKLQ